MVVVLTHTTFATQAFSATHNDVAAEFSQRVLLAQRLVPFHRIVPSVSKMPVQIAAVIFVNRSTGLVLTVHLFVVDTNLASVFSMTNVYTCIVLYNVIHPLDGLVTVTCFLTVVIGLFLYCIVTSRHDLT